MGQVRGNVGHQKGKNVTKLEKAKIHIWNYAQNGRISTSGPRLLHLPTFSGKKQDTTGELARSQFCFPDHHATFDVNLSRHQSVVNKLRPPIN